jgi:hypothetical protein
MFDSYWERKHPLFVAIIPSKDSLGEGTEKQFAGRIVSKNHFALFPREVGVAEGAVEFFILKVEYAATLVKESKKTQK